MLIAAIPRGSFVARLVAADLLVRLQDMPRRSLELQEAVSMVGIYIVDPTVNLSDAELKRYQSTINKIYQS